MRARSLRRRSGAFSPTSPLRSSLPPNSRELELEACRTLEAKVLSYVPYGVAKSNKNIPHCTIIAPILASTSAVIDCPVCTHQHCRKVKC
eukprot:1672153-Rhodomonas_salina.1